MKRLDIHPGVVTVASAARRRVRGVVSVHERASRDCPSIRLR
jgi:hypothetical protein